MSQYPSQQLYGPANQGRSFSFMPVIIGAAVGLIVGLIIGWVIWPVQWTNAWPGDLSDEAKAQYLASVAQVYAYYPNDRAAETARTRLYDLEPNIEEEIAAAQAFFAENPQRDSNVYITMLSEMAAGLGVASDAPALVEAADAQSSADAAAADDGPSWARWIFSGLVVLLLLGGGLYILSKLAAGRRNQGSGRADAPPQDGYVSPQPASGARSTRGGFPAPPPDDYRFDQEADDGIVFTAGTSVVEGHEPEDDTYFGDESAAGYAQPGTASAVAYGAYAASDESYYRRPSASVAQAYETEIDERSVEEVYLDEDYAEEDHTAETYTAEAAYAEEEYVEEEYVEEEVYESRSAGEQAPQAVAVNQAAADAPVQTQPAAMLNTYIVHYEAGVAEYEQSHNIVDATGRYIGECGMGVNMKNGILQDVPENVIALDVWLFDQRHDRSLGNQTRVLLSEYAVDNGLEPTFVRERPDGPAPLVAQPGVSFKLKGQNLDVDCEILEAEYAAADSGQPIGIFQNVKIEMTVRSRT